MKLKYLSWLPAVLIMAMIFLFSSKPAEVSEQDSLTISKSFILAYEQLTDNDLTGPTEAALLTRIDHVVRKTAHFTEYALLAAAIAFHFMVWKMKFNYALFSIIIAGLYACTDEYHQTFLSGRSGQISDVLLDTAGAVTGILCFMWIRRIRLKKTGSASCHRYS